MLRYFFHGTQSKEIVQKFYKYYRSSTLVTGLRCRGGGGGEGLREFKTVVLKMQFTPKKSKVKNFLFFCWV
jgi:hypothetical protein